MKFLFRTAFEALVQKCQHLAGSLAAGADNENVPERGLISAIAVGQRLQDSIRSARDARLLRRRPRRRLGELPFQISFTDFRTGSRRLPPIRKSVEEI